MGCDIHLHQEVKINGKWQHYGTPDIGRNYRLFALLADVRNDSGIVPISTPRGLPEDITELTKFIRDDYGTDGHSDSYIDAEEIASLKDDYEKVKYTGGDVGWRWESDKFGYFFGNDWSGFIKYPEERTKGLEDIRFVFWFDN